MENYEDTIISQYATAPALTQLLRGWNENLDPTPLLDSFYNLVWNVNTAEGWGLDVWGRIVGVGRVLQLASTRFFGFQEADSVVITGFNVAPFYSGQSVTTNYTLSDAAYRVLVLAKALANICDGSIQGTNAVLMALFPGRGNAYVIDHRDMTMTYFFDFELAPIEYAIIFQSGVLPRPAGVATSVASSSLNRIQLESGTGRILLESGFGAINLESS